jgi:branched-chain amino acid transport system substrate-binding protein
VRIGVTTILSGSDAARGQTEQYGIELALQRINEAGGVLGRPVEVFMVTMPPIRGPAFAPCTG